MTRFARLTAHERWTLLAILLVAPACLGCVGSLVEGLLFGPPPEPLAAEPISVYYYDLNTGELFVGDSVAVPPIDAPSGGLVLNGQVTDRHAGVKAYVYSCRSCDDLSSLFIGWLEMYTPQVKAQLENPGDFFGPDITDEQQMAAMEAFEAGHLITQPAANVSQMRWVPGTSEEGFTLVARIQESCGGDRIPEVCLPPRRK